MKRAVFHIFWTSIAFLLVLAGGCMPVSKSVFSTSIRVSGQDDLMHKVRWEGESLALVAKWYTGRPENWNAIAGANPTLDPKKIIVGNSIRIPSRLLITRKPMPKRFLTGAIESDAFPPAVDAGKVSAPAPAEKAGGPKAGPPAGKEEEPPLFGPKAYQE